MSQNEQILAYLKSGKAITSMDALKMYGCFRLASRVNDLRNEGWEIRTSMIGSKMKRFAAYWMPLSQRTKGEKIK